MATSAPPELEEYRRQAIAAAGAVAVAASLRLPALYDFDNPEASFALWVNRVVPAVVTTSRKVTALARSDYRIAQARAGITERPAWVERPVVADAMRASLYATAFAPLQGIEKTAPERMAQARTDLTGAIVRQTMNAGRNSTIATASADQKVLGAVFVTKGDDRVCYWCQMLASRVVVRGNYLGPIFKVDSFDASDRLFIGSGTAKTHDHCRCVVRPVYSLDDPLLQDARDLYDRWLAATKGFSGKAKMKAWRRSLVGNTATPR